MRKNFSTLRLNKGHVYLDNAATSLKLNSATKLTNLFASKLPLNSHSNSDSEEYLVIEKVFRDTRGLIAKWINARDNEISFIPSVTYGLNLLALSLDHLVKKNCSIVITETDHSSNIYPWLSLGERKAVGVEYLYLDNNYSIDKERIIEKVNKSTILVSFSHITNNLGSLSNVGEIVTIIKSINPDCFIVVDACQSISCSFIDVKKWNIDALVFSSHKFYGPDGIAVLWLRKEFEQKLPHLLWGGGKKISPSSRGTQVNNCKRFEVGTISAAQVAGLGEVFRFISNFNWENLIAKQKKLKKYAVDCLTKIKEVEVYNREGQGNILLFNIKNFHSQDVSSYLARNKVFVRAGDFCSPFLKKLIGRSNAVRLSLAIYNTKRDVDMLVYHLRRINIENCLE